MPKQIITDTFETLGKAAGQVVKQAAQEPGKMAESAAQQIGTQAPGESVEQPQGQIDPVQQALNKRAAKQKLTYLQEELERLRQRKAQELPPQITGKPGFSEEAAIKQLGVEKKKEPLPIVQAKRSSGTGERKIKGISG